MTKPQTIADLTNTITSAPRWAQAAGTAVVLAGIYVIAATVRSARRRIRAADRKKSISTLINVAALMATSVQASGMWKFFGNTMGLPVGFRIVLFSFMEIALLACGLRARANVEEGGDAGIDGLLVWVLAIASGLMSSTEANSPQEALMRVLVSCVVALLWTRDLMAAKQAARKTAAGIRPKSRVRWRITPERIFVFLRLADAVDTDVSTIEAGRKVVKFLRAKNRERDGWRWPFTKTSIAYRGRMRLISGAMPHGDPVDILRQISNDAFNNALHEMGVAQTATGPDQRTGPDQTNPAGKSVPDQTGPSGSNGPDQTTGPDRQTGPAPYGPTGPDQTGGPDRQTGPDRTAGPRPDQTDTADRTRRADQTGPTRTADQTGPDHMPDHGPDRTVARRRTGSKQTASLETLERICKTWAEANGMELSEMRRRHVLEAIREQKLSCSNERAGEVLLLLDPNGAGAAWMNKTLALQTGPAGPR